MIQLFLLAMALVNSARAKREVDSFKSEKSLSLSDSTEDQPDIDVEREKKTSRLNVEGTTPSTLTTTLISLDDLDLEDEDQFAKALEKHDFEQEDELNKALEKDEQKQKNKQNKELGKSEGTQSELPTDKEKNTTVNQTTAQRRPRKHKDHPKVKAANTVSKKETKKGNKSDSTVKQRSTGFSTHVGKFLFGWADRDSRTYSLSQAKKRCRELGASDCGGVTCNAATTKCTVRGSKTLENSATGEITYLMESDSTESTSKDSVSKDPCNDELAEENCMEEAEEEEDINHQDPCKTMVVAGTLSIDTELGETMMSIHTTMDQDTGCHNGTGPCMAHWHRRLGKCQNIEKVIFPHHNKNLKRIPPESFKDWTQLKMIVIGRSVEKIGRDAFHGCTSLVSISFAHQAVKQAVAARGLKAIESNAFADTAVRKVTIPSTVEVIEKRAFYKCKDLSELTFAAGLADADKPNDNLKDMTPLRIDRYAFAETALTEVSIPASVEDLSFVFHKCYSLSKVTFENMAPDGRLKKIGVSAFRQTALTEVSIPASVEEIEPKAFVDAASLSKVVFTDPANTNGKLKSINERAFQGTGLKEMTIPASVQSIGDRAFYRCKSLSKMIFFPNGKLGAIDWEAFKDTALKEVSLPELTVEISEGAFDPTVKMTRLQTSKEHGPIKSSSSNRDSRVITSVLVGLILHMF